MLIRFNLKLLFVAIILLICGFALSKFFAIGQKVLDPQNFHGTFLRSPRQLSNFSLNGIDAKKFDNRALRGRWTMLFFGFTRCGYLCPTTMAELAKMYRILEAKNVTPLPRVVMISVDPARDSLARLQQYTHSFHPDFYGAGGDSAIIKQITKELGIAYIKVALSDKVDHYDIQHTGTIMLVNPQGQLQAFFTSPQQAPLIAEDYQRIIG